MNSRNGGAPKQCTIRDWLQKISGKKLMLPSFQRGLVWNNKKTEDLLCSLLNSKPVGTLLLLDYEGEERKSPFKSRGIRNAPKPDENSCEQLILDGQQRLTALWRAFDIDYQEDGKDYYPRLFAKIEDKDVATFDTIQDVETKKQKKQFKETDFRETWRDNLIPIGILGTSMKIRNWCADVCPNDVKKSHALEDKINVLSERLNGRDISYYCLPQATTRDEAIDVFIKTNQSSAKISRFDIAVAEIEREKGELLRDQIENIDIDNGRRDRFFGDDLDSRTQVIGELVLKVACLRSDKLPTVSNYISKEVIEMISDEWEGIVKGIDWALDIFESESIFDAKRLPGSVPLQALVALHKLLSSNPDPDYQGVFLKTIRKYVWRAFLTDRYERTANDKLFEDYKGLKEYLDGPMDKHVTEYNNIPIFRKKDFPLPEVSQLSSLELSSPTTTNRLARALLCISLRNGAKDLATDDRITAENIRKRQYHHLFPKALLENERGKGSVGINHALNFALISDKTNNKLKAKPPIEYLRERLSLHCDEGDIKERLNSHHVPFEELNVETGKGRKYEKFIKRRAEIFDEIIRKELCP